MASECIGQHATLNCSNLFIINTQQVDMVADTPSSEKCTVVLTGYLRAHNLSVNQLVIRSTFVIALKEWNMFAFKKKKKEWNLFINIRVFLRQVHVAGAGDFQLSKIELLKDPSPLNVRKGIDVMDSESDIQVCYSKSRIVFLCKEFILREKKKKKKI